MRKIEIKLESFYKWLKSNIIYVDNNDVIIRIGKYGESSSNTLYGNYENFCKNNNLPQLGLNHFRRLIFKFFDEKSLLIELYIDKKLKYIKKLKLIEKC